jgi:hypothetical protein
MGSQRRDRRAVAAALVSYLVLAVALLGGAWRHPTTTFTGQSLDPPIVMWFLKWVPWAVLHGHNPLFSHYLNAPAGVNVTWNVSFILPALVMAPITETLGVVVTYNLLATAAVAGSAFTAFVVFRRIAHFAFAAWIGGLIFGFSPILLSQLQYHLHIASAYLLPLLALAAWEALAARRGQPLRCGLVLGLLAAFQFLISEEFLALAVVTVGVAAVTFAFAHRGCLRPVARDALRALIVAGITFVVVVCPVLAFQLFGAGRVSGQVQAFDKYVADASAYAIPSKVQLLHPFGSATVAGRFPAGFGEYGAYLGIPLVLALIAIVIWQRRRPGVLPVAAALVILFILSLGPHLRVLGHNTGVPLPWLAFKHVPLLNNILPVRLAVGITFFASGLLALGVDRVLAAKATIARNVALVVSLAVICIPLLPALPFPDSSTQVPAFFTSPAVKMLPPASLTLTVPYPDTLTDRVMLWQVASDMRYRSFGGYVIVPDSNGHPVFVGRNFPLRALTYQLEQGNPPALDNPSTRAGLVADVRAEAIQNVVIGPIPHQPAAVAYITDLLGAPPVATGGVFVWTGVQALVARG